MESKAKILGHPAHQLLIVFPLGLLATAVIFDIIYLINHNVTLATVAWYMISAGLIGGLVAAPFGTVDWLAIPSGTRAKRVGLLHGLGNVMVLILFAISWLFRQDNPDFVPSSAALGTSFAAFALAGVTGWLGGELVDRLGVGVDQGAHLNAPSSLSGRPAIEGKVS